jgi:hypothetical protein
MNKFRKLSLIDYNGHMEVHSSSLLRNGPIALKIAKLPELLQRRSVILNASASGISCTPAVGSALLAHAGSGLADTVDHHPARATAHTSLCDRTVRLMQRREQRCMCGGSERQPEQSKHYCFDHYCFDHCFLLVVQNTFLCVVC